MQMAHEYQVERKKKKISLSRSLFANADFTSPVLTVARQHSLVCAPLIDSEREREIGRMNPKLDFCSEVIRSL